MYTCIHKRGGDNLYTTTCIQGELHVFCRYANKEKKANGAGAGPCHHAQKAQANSIKEKDILGTTDR